MNKAKFTKGPWVVLPQEIDKNYIRIRGTQLGERYKIADVHNISYTYIPNDLDDLLNDESEANANLIACAPEYYNQCEYIVTELNTLLNKFSLGSPVSIKLNELVGEIKELQEKARGEK